ncbi:MAG: SCP2 sterol-binding domain-containing protein [Syntrophales bacterium]
MAESPKDSIEKLKAKLKADPDTGKGIDAVYQFSISGEGGGEWWLDLTKSPAQIGEGAHGDAGCTIRMNAPDFVALLNRSASPVMLYMSGKLKIEGDMNLALKLQGLFG